MAANMNKVAGKRFIINHFRRSLIAITPPSIPLSLSRGLHESVYKKEVGEEVPQTDTPLAGISPEPQEYWEPDSETGVFVPASEKNSEQPVNCTTQESVLDEKAFFRPLEDLEPPLPESFKGEIPPVDPFTD